MEIARHKTAMHRTTLSKPVSLALSDGVLRPGLSAFDYGCGRGTDVGLLVANGYTAEGWDPHFRSNTTKSPADVVNLGYVLNVIENPKERALALKAAYDLAKQVLVVSVRVDKNSLDGEEFEDGVVTKRGGFQKFFTQAELKEFIEAVLGKTPEFAGLGIAYVFSSEEAYQSYLTNRLTSRQVEYRRDVFDLFSKDGLAQEYLKECRKRGRRLRPKEFTRFGELVEKFGTQERVQRLTSRLLSPEDFATYQEENRVAILGFLAGSILRRFKPKISELPALMQSDIRTLWGTYEKAREAAQAFLFKIGEKGAVDDACKASKIGKLLPEDLYLHRSALESCPQLIQLVVQAAEMIVGPQPSAELLKISRHGKSMSFLWYPDFDSAPHPELKRSLRVYLPKADYQIRDFSQSENPPILHRKETFVAEDYPTKQKFEKLTKQEEKAGLLEKAPGFKREWMGLLLSSKYCFRGHILVKIKS